jgi:DNA-binding NarL/FixJ family response regulator
MVAKLGLPPDYLAKEGGYPHVLRQFLKKWQHTSDMGLANVVLIEDDPFIRTILVAALEAGNIRVCDSGSLAMVALMAQAREQVDVAILDIDLGAGPSGIDIAYALREVNPAIGIVLLTSFSDPRLSGAQGLALPKGTRYITKSQIENLAKLLTIVLMAKHSPLDAHGRNEPAFLKLTAQQISVVKLVATSATNSEIARQLDVSEKAIEHMISRINEGLGLEKSTAINSRVQLVRKFAELTGGQLP